MFSPNWMTNPTLLEEPPVGFSPQSDEGKAAILFLILLPTEYMRKGFQNGCQRINKPSSSNIKPHLGIVLLCRVSPIQILVEKEPPSSYIQINLRAPKGAQEVES